MPEQAQKQSLLVTGSLNTHVGTVINQGGLNWSLRRYPRAVLWSLQEVMAPDQLEKELPKGWGAIHTKKLHADTKKMVDSAIIFKHNRFELDSWAAPWNGHGEKTEDGKQLRPRYRTTAQLLDKITGRTVAIGAMHNAPLGKGFVDAAEGARKMHEAQVQAYIDWAKDIDPEAVLLIGGDWNERLNQNVTGDLAARCAEGRLATVGMSFVNKHIKGGDVGLDDYAYRTDHFVKPTSRTTFWTPAKGEDHPGVVVRFKITHKAA